MRVSRNGYRTAHTGVDTVVKVSGGNVHDALLVWRGSSLVVERHLDTAQGTLEGRHLFVAISVLTPIAISIWAEIDGWYG